MGERPRTTGDGGPARRPILQAQGPSPADLAAENARLRRENERLRMERDISKRMARPVRKGVVKDGKMVCINVSGLKAGALAKMEIRAA